MTERSEGPPAVPWHIRFFGPILEKLLGFGVPIGPNQLITIRGRTTGLPRTTGVAVLEVGGRRWIWAPWGEVNWVRNLRAAGRATIGRGGKEQEVTATELDQVERVRFFRDVLGPFARSIPFGLTFVRVIDGVDLADPVKAAEGRRVFELHPISGRDTSAARP